MLTNTTVVLSHSQASCGCRLFQPTVVERQQTRCVYVGCNSLIVLGGQVYLFFKTLRKNRCLACNSFPHHWNKAEYSGDAPDDDDLDYNQHFIVIHSQPIIILIGVHWFINFRIQSTLNFGVPWNLSEFPSTHWREARCFEILDMGGT